MVCGSFSLVESAVQHFCTDVQALGAPVLLTGDRGVAPAFRALRIWGSRSGGKVPA